MRVVYTYLLGMMKSILYLLLYVKDIWMESYNIKEINNFKETLNEEFEMKDLGKHKTIIGMKSMGN